MRKKKKGIFITIEGGEGTGKTTQARLLIRYLRQRGWRVLLTQEPGGTRVGILIRRILLNPAHTEIDKFCELFLYLADRVQHVREVIVPALEAGNAVISDRFADAALAYQGFGRGINRGLIANLNRIATQGIKPDLTICLDTGVQKSLQRARLRRSQDRLDNEGIAFHTKVRKGYLNLSRREPGRIKVIKILTTPKKTHDLIKVYIDKLLKRKCGKLALRVLAEGRTTTKRSDKLHRYKGMG